MDEGSKSKHVCTNLNRNSLFSGSKISTYIFFLWYIYVTGLLLVQLILFPSYLFPYPLSFNSYHVGKASSLSSLALLFTHKCKNTKNSCPLGSRCHWLSGSGLHRHMHTPCLAAPTNPPYAGFA
jgi:hypothetical protein